MMVANKITHLPPFWQQYLRGFFWTNHQVYLTFLCIHMRIWLFKSSILANFFVQETLLHLLFFDKVGLTLNFPHNFHNFLAGVTRYICYPSVLKDGLATVKGLFWCSFNFSQFSIAKNRFSFITVSFSGKINVLNCLFDYPRIPF